MKETNNLLKEEIGERKRVDNGKVGIRVRKMNGFVEFSISYTGIGIEREKMENIFKPLTQLDPSTRRKYSGTGLVVAKRLWKLTAVRFG